MTALYKTGDYTTATQRYSAGIIETIVPYNAKINYKYFKDNTPYTFFEFEIPSDILEKGANDFSTMLVAHLHLTTTMKNGTN